MKKLLLVLFLIGCKPLPDEPTTRLDTRTYGERISEIPDWVPKGIVVELKDGKVVLTADLARALVKESEVKQWEALLHGIAITAEMGRREYRDEFEGEARVLGLVKELTTRGFAVEAIPAKNDWYILVVTW